MFFYKKKKYKFKAWNFWSNSFFFFNFVNNNIKLFIQKNFPLNTPTTTNPIYLSLTLKILSKTNFFTKTKSNQKKIKKLIKFIFSKYKSRWVFFFVKYINLYFISSLFLLKNFNSFFFFFSYKNNWANHHIKIFRNIKKRIKKKIYKKLLLKL